MEWQQTYEKQLLEAIYQTASVPIFYTTIVVNNCFYGKKSSTQSSFRPQTDQQI